MASIIKLKRSVTAGAQPGSLEVGEIAVNLFDRKLYVGNSSGVSAIGGEDFRLTVDEGSVSGDGAYIKLLGETSDSTNSIFLQAGAGMDVTKQANGSITFGIENASTTNVGGASFNSNNFVVDSNGLASIAPSGITLGGETSGNYVATVNAGNNSLVVTGSGTETAGVTVALGDNIGANTTGNARTATSWATQRNIGVRLAGDISGYANTNIDGSGNVLIDVTTAIQPNSIALGTDTTGNYVATVGAGNNSILVTGSGTETAGITVALVITLVLIQQVMLEQQQRLLQPEILLFQVILSVMRALMVAVMLQSQQRFSLTQLHSVQIQLVITLQHWLLQTTHLLLVVLVPNQLRFL